MSYKKYLEDSRLEEYIDGSGRIKTKAVYKGDYYTIEPLISAQSKMHIIAATAAAWVACIGALMQITNAVRQPYVLVPFVITAIPLIFVTAAAVKLQYTKALMTRKDADYTAGRLPINSALSMFFSGGATIAYLIAISISERDILTGDIIFGILALITAIASAFVFVKTRKLKPCKIETQQLQEEKKNEENHQAHPCNSSGNVYDARSTHRLPGR